MTITNDILTFENSDLLQFSTALQSAIIFRAGVQVPSEYLSIRINAVLQECLKVHNDARLADPENQEISLAFAKADTATQNQVKSTLGIAMVLGAGKI